MPAFTIGITRFWVDGQHVRVSVQSFIHVRYRKCEGGRDSVLRCWQVLVWSSDRLMNLNRGVSELIALGAGFFEANVVFDVSTV